MSSETTRKRYLAGIGTRLTLWGAGLTTLLIAATCALLYAGMYFSMRSQIDAFLEGEIYEFMLTVNEHPNDDKAMAAYFQQELGARSRKDLGFRLIDAEGGIFVSSAREDELTGMWTPPANWMESAPHVLCQTVVPQGRPYAHRVCSLRVQTADGRICTAQSSYLLDQMSHALARFRRICFLVLVVAPLVALGVGGFLAWRSLRPVRHIIETAQKMGANDLRERVPFTGTGDEMDQLAITLNEMLHRIEEQVKKIQRFTADASHELRTPLAALRGIAELALSRQRSTEELRQTIEESVIQYERLQRIAEDLLLLTRLDAGESVIRHETLSLDAAVRDVVDLFTPTAEEKGLSLVVEKVDPLLIKGDDGRLRQVIGNLLDNAIKYTASKGQIGVSLAQSNGHARLQVTDTGMGISAEDMPRVFDRFYRADPSRSAVSAAGVGLGLSICRSIIEAHGGRIHIESSPRQGTRVLVSVPVDREAQATLFSATGLTISQ